MNTLYEKVDPDNIDQAIIEKAGSIIKAGGLVAFPTETVYGLGGDAFLASSAKKIYSAKGRPSDNPLIVHIADYEAIDAVAYVPDCAKALADLFWPGPLTMIMKKKPEVPAEVTGGLDTVAVRFPSHPVAMEFIRASGGYVAAPSANISGRPSPTSARHVKADMDGRIDMIIDSGECDIGLESTIIDLTGDEPMLLRPGYVSEEMLGKALGSVKKDPAVFGTVDSGIAPKAPGMKYRHYAPKGEMTIVSGERESVIRFISERLLEKKDGKRIGVLACSEDVRFFEKADLVGELGSIGDEKKIASALYSLLRRCDDENIDIIYSEEFDTPQLGLAIMNRLIKAAGHKVVKVG